MRPQADDRWERVARRTGGVRYLAPVPRAVAWLSRSRLPDGRSPRPESDTARKLVPRIREILAALDSRGAWVEPGKLSSDDRQRGPDGVISSATFIKNIGTLAEYLAATGTSDRPALLSPAAQS